MFVNVVCVCIVLVKMISILGIFVVLFGCSVCRFCM